MMKFRLVQSLTATPLFIVLSAGVSFWVLLVPMKFIEPDDVAFYHAMRMFSHGVMVAGEDDLRAVTGDMGYGPVHAPGWFLTERGFIFEKSPGYAFLLAAAHHMRLERLLNPAIVFLCMVLMLFMLAKPPWNRSFAVSAALLFGANPTIMILSSRTYMSDVSSAAMVTLGGLAFLAAETGGRRRMYLLAGLLFGLAVVMRYTNLILLMALPCYFAASGFMENRMISGWTRRFREPGLWHVYIGAALPLIFQAAYNLVTTGGVFTTGYSYGMRADGIPQFSFGYLGRNLLDEAPALLLGFPALVLLPFGVSALARRSARAALVTLFMVFPFFALYLLNAWARADQFSFTARFYLPAAFGIALAGAAALESHASKKASAFCLVLIVSISFLFAGDYVRRYVLAPTPAPRMGTIRGGPLPGGGPGMQFPRGGPKDGPDEFMPMEGRE